MLKYNDGVKGLKKTSEGYFDKISGQIFIKDKDGLKIVVQEYDKKLFKSQLNRLKNMEKKYHVSLKTEINDLTNAWNEYNKYVKKFNNREVKWTSTVESRYRAFETIGLKQEKLFGNVTISKEAKRNFNTLITNKKKTMLLRMSGHKGVYDDNSATLYNDFLNQFASKLGISASEVESIIFPIGFEESSKYEDIIELLDSAYYTMQDIIEQKVSEGVISDYEAITLENLLDTGLGGFFG